MKNDKILNELHEYRLNIMAKISENEKTGRFDVDVEDDPPIKKLMPNDVDYLNEKLSSKINTFIANFIAIRNIRRLIKKNQLIIKNVIGLENLTSLNEGCILTCNHFNPYDNFALHDILYRYLKKSKRKLYKVIREGNYSFKGMYGYFFRHCDTLPLSSNIETMRNFNSAIDKLLKLKNIILIYPEQAMWWNYRKPRPLKQGAYKFAVRYNVPIIPCFITMNDSGILGKDGFNIQEYTVQFFNPLYPDNNLLPKDQIKQLCDKNYMIWVNAYENFYHEKLEYEKI